MLWGHKDYVLCVLFKSNGIILYSASKDKTIKAWDMDIYNLIATLEGHED